MRLLIVPERRRLRSTHTGRRLSEFSWKQFLSSLMVDKLRELAVTFGVPLVAVALTAVVLSGGDVGRIGELLQQYTSVSQEHGGGGMWQWIEWLGVMLGVLSILASALGANRRMGYRRRLRQWRVGRD